jgi:hypothetical protein
MGRDLRHLVNTMYDPGKEGRNSIRQSMTSVKDQQGMGSLFPMASEGNSGVESNGTISRRNFLPGQCFPQFLRGQLEELPEAQVRQFHTHQAVRRLTLAAADPELAKVPVQPL